MLQRLRGESNLILKQLSPICNKGETSCQTSDHCAFGQWVKRVISREALAVYTLMYRLAALSDVFGIWGILLSKTIETVAFDKELWHTSESPFTGLPELTSPYCILVTGCNPVVKLASLLAASAASFSGIRQNPKSVYICAGSLTAVANTVQCSSQNSLVSTKLVGKCSEYKISLIVLINLALTCKNNGTAKRAGAHVLMPEKKSTPCNFAAFE